MLREMIARRVSTLKQAGVKLPIISEVAIPAKVISINGFNQPTLLDYEQATQELAMQGQMGRTGVQLPQVPQLRSILDALKNIPQIAYGTAYGEEAGQWYSVAYPKQITNAIPVAVAEGRLGEIIVREINRISDIIRVNRDDFTSDLYCDLIGGGARDRAKAIVQPPWPLDGIWNFMCDLVYWIFWAGWKMSGWILNILWDSFVQKQIDCVRDSINVQTNEIRDALNARLADLYSMWGIPQNMALTSVHVRNTASWGFEFQSYGATTIHWIAIGM